MNICDDIMMVVMSYLPNYDIFNMYYINRRMYNILNTSYMLDLIKYRPHPAVFNVIDNYCHVCNFKIVFFCDLLNFARCNHF